MARRHTNALSAQIPMALRHHARHVATRSAHALEANVSHDTANHPAHQRHAAFTPACFALPSGTAPHKHTSHCNITNVISPQGLPIHYKQTCHMIPQIIPLTSDTPRLHQPVSRSPVARRHASALSTKAVQIPMALRRHERRTVCPYTRSKHVT